VVESHIACAHDRRSTGFIQSAKKQQHRDGSQTLEPLARHRGFCLGIYTYRDTSGQQLNRQRAEAERTAETRRIEATRPYLDKQLALYTEATVGMSWQRRGAPTRGSAEF